VALQARAEATRQKIIDAAVDLFGTTGFGETGLADIISAADVTKGSFYYHFDSKEAVATAIIDKSEEEFRASTIAVLSSPTSPALDNLIRSTFANRILADALGDDIFAQLVQMWQVLLRGIVPAQSLPYFSELVSRMAQRYEHRTTNSPGDT
jgi:AcrR family transcriptional regulator